MACRGEEPGILGHNLVDIKIENTMSDFLSDHGSICDECEAGFFAPFKSRSQAMQAIQIPKKFPNIQVISKKSYY